MLASIQTPWAKLVLVSQGFIQSSIKNLLSKDRDSLGYLKVVPVFNHYL